MWTVSIPPRARIKPANCDSVLSVHYRGDTSKIAYSRAGERLMTDLLQTVKFKLGLCRTVSPTVLPLVFVLSCTFQAICLQF